MREKDKLHFSPKYIFADLNFGDKDKTIDAFKDRVDGFYLEPAKLLDKKYMGFGCGLLCITTIDLLARLTYPRSKKRIEDWLKNNIQEFQKVDFAERFYKDFRCGLVHEGRIKPFGEFSYEAKQIVTSEHNVIRINPHILLERIGQAFEEYLKKLENDPKEFNVFKNILKNDYNAEIMREKTL
jgi:hypothetical protein